MTRGEAWLLNAANLLVGGTGVVYAVMRYFVEPADEWAVVNHPWQPHVQHLHVLSAPLLVFACGMVWRRHALRKLRHTETRGRRSGPGLLLSFVPMVASGYLIQTTVAPWWRQTWIAVHLICSAAWLAAFAGHWIRAHGMRGRSAVASPSTPGRTPALERTRQPVAGKR